MVFNITHKVLKNTEDHLKTHLLIPPIDPRTIKVKELSASRWLMLVETWEGIRHP